MVVRLQTNNYRLANVKTNIVINFIIVLFIKIKVLCEMLQVFENKLEI